MGLDTKLNPLYTRQRAISRQPCQTSGDNHRKSRLEGFGMTRLDLIRAGLIPAPSFTTSTCKPLASRHNGGNLRS
jgi:hypothetical protein